MDLPVYHALPRHLSRINIPYADQITLFRHTAGLAGNGRVGICPHVHLLRLQGKNYYIFLTV